MTDLEKIEKKKEYKKKYYQLNKEKMKNNVKEYRKLNSEKVKQYAKEYNELNKDRIIEYTKLNKDRIKEYRKLNKDKIKEKRKEYRKLNKDKKYIYKKNKRIKDPLYKLSDNIRTLIYNSIKRKGFKKQSRTEMILGISFEDFKIYIEKQFSPFMNWDNYGLYNGQLNYGWDLDHTIPISFGKSESDIINLNYYSNFQPLDSAINRDMKKDKIFYKVVK